MDVTTLSESVGYFNASLDRSVGFQPDHEDGPATVTRALPATYEAELDIEGSRYRLVMVIDAFEESADDVRIGIRSVELSAHSGVLRANHYKSVPVRQLLKAALRLWSWNSDGSKVTERQAERLLRSLTAQVGAGRPEHRWREAAQAYLAAQRTNEPTTVAVARALNLGTGKRGQDNARQLIRRARKSGIFDEVAREQGENR